MPSDTEITITISGKPKTGKSTLLMAIANFLDLMHNINVTISTNDKLDNQRLAEVYNELEERMKIVSKNVKIKMKEEH